MKKISGIIGLALLCVCGITATAEARTNFSINIGGPAVYCPPPAPVVIERRLAPAVYVERPVAVRYVEPAVYERPAVGYVDSAACARPVVVYQQQPVVEEVAVYQAPVARPIVAPPPLFSFSWNWFRR